MLEALLSGLVLVALILLVLTGAVGIFLLGAALVITVAVFSLPLAAAIVVGAYLQGLFNVKNGNFFPILIIVVFVIIYILQ